MSSSSGGGDGGGVGPKLPQDVAVEILKRLPVKSLLRFRCVSRSWRSAIDDPAFVALHARHSALYASNWYLVCLDYRGDLQDRCSLVPHDSLTLPSLLRVETPFVTPPPRGFYFVGSCNGLICLADRNGEGPYMYLWNLFTRKHKVIQVFPCPEEPQFRCKPADSGFLGFGFDAGSNDYKIVRILSFQGDDRRWFGRVGIYSLRTDSWRSLRCQVPAFHEDSQAVFLNGNLHWVAFKLDDMGCVSEDASLFLFNVASEVFDEMALPENTSASSLLSVAVLNDLLAVFFRADAFDDNDDYYSVCSVWVMRDYGVPQSWTNLCTFQVDEVVARFYGWMCNGELLMEIDSFDIENRISLNPITHEVTVLPLPRITDLIMVFENLVSLEI
ncbi:putative F-box protein At3g16210 isoform X1 [Eucalyptus grandis]|uniref:putative F-box protein At3g16210 isoform X1 n=1 Tax=Eucalyptus grandis TaxID=71139 RepID=UPI00192E9D76|nr:putative F-box protein At3g16210 isoform X1 [Eucalyptus grandis]